MILALKALDMTRWLLLPWQCDRNCLCCAEVNVPGLARELVLAVRWGASGLWSRKQNGRAVVSRLSAQGSNLWQRGTANY